MSTRNQRFGYRSYRRQPSGIPFIDVFPPPRVKEAPEEAGAKVFSVEFKGPSGSLGFPVLAFDAEQAIELGRYRLEDSYNDPDAQTCEGTARQWAGEAPSTREFILQIEVGRETESRRARGKAQP